MDDWSLSGEIVLYNIFYEVSSLCTSVVGQDPNGYIVHGRSLDFGLLMGYGDRNIWQNSSPVQTLYFLVGIRSITHGCYRRNYVHWWLKSITQRMVKFSFEQPVSLGKESLIHRKRRMQRDQCCSFQLHRIVDRCEARYLQYLHQWTQHRSGRLHRSGGMDLQYQSQSIFHHLCHPWYVDGGGKLRPSGSIFSQSSIARSMLLHHCWTESWTSEIRSSNASYGHVLDHVRRESSSLVHEMDPKISKCSVKTIYGFLLKRTTTTGRNNQSSTTVWHLALNVCKRKDETRWISDPCSTFSPRDRCWTR